MPNFVKIRFAVSEVKYTERDNFLMTRSFHALRAKTHKMFTHIHVARGDLTHQPSIQSGPQHRAPRDHSDRRLLLIIELEGWVCDKSKMLITLCSSRTWKPVKEGNNTQTSFQLMPLCLRK
jgi:hypothetical protein